MALLFWKMPRARGDDQGHACPTCYRVFAYANNLSRHKALCDRRLDPTECIHCTKKLSTISNRSKHERICSCRNKPSVASQPVSIVQNNIVNQHNFILIHPSSSLREFGQENMDHISPNFIRDCFIQGRKGIIPLLEKIHFDRDRKENHNVLIYRVREALFRIFHEGRWKIADKESVLDTMLRKGHRILYRFYRDNPDIIDISPERQKVVLDSLNDYIFHEEKHQRPMHRQLFALIMDQQMVLLEGGAL